MVLDLESELGISQDDTEALLRHYAVADMTRMEVS